MNDSYQSIKLCDYCLSGGGNQEGCECIKSDDENNDSANIFNIMTTDDEADDLNSHKLKIKKKKEKSPHRIMKDALQTYLDYEQNIKYNYDTDKDTKNITIIWKNLKLYLSLELSTPENYLKLMYWRNVLKVLKTSKMNIIWRYIY